MVGHVILGGKKKSGWNLAGKNVLLSVGTKQRDRGSCSVLKNKDAEGYGVVHLCRVHRNRSKTNRCSYIDS
eukprot:Em0003g1901a